MFKMIKNIFIEASIISALVFGGFYIYATYMKDKMDVSQPAPANHISGLSQPRPAQNQDWQHVSGSGTPSR